MSCPKCGNQMKEIGAAVDMRTSKTVVVIYHCRECRKCFQDWRDEG